MGAPLWAAGTLLETGSVLAEGALAAEGSPSSSAQNGNWMECLLDLACLLGVVTQGAHLSGI